MKQQKAPKLSAQTRVADAIRNAIFTGELQPGDPLTELRLSERYEVSQTTVREALVRLEHAGLVRRVHNVGTFVTQMAGREIQERLRLRVMLEGLAAMEAARLASARQLAAIDAQFEALSKAIARNDYYECGQADLEFHRMIWRCTGDATLYQILDGLTVPLFAFASMMRQRSHEKLADAVRAHGPIVAALRRRDPSAAQQAMRQHIETSYAEFLAPAQAYTLAIG